MIGISNVAKLLIFFVVLAIFSNCKTNSSIVAVSPRSSGEVLNGLDQRTITYNFFSAKARIKFNGVESRLGGHSTIRMIRDSVIMMNFKKFSVEGARSLIRNDSCWILYRMDDLYESGPTSEFLEYYKINVTFRDMQDLLVGNVYIPDQNELLNFKIGSYYQFSFINKEYFYEYLVKDDFSIYKILIRDIFERQMVVTLTDYDDDFFATRKEFEISAPDEGISKISMKFSNVEFDVPKAITFEIPAYYTRLP